MEYGKLYWSLESGGRFSRCRADRPPLNFVQTQRERLWCRYWVGINDSCWTADYHGRVPAYHLSLPWYNPRGTWYYPISSDLVQFCAIRHLLVRIIISSFNYYYYTLRYVTCLLKDLTVKMFNHTLLFTSCMSLRFCSSNFVFLLLARSSTCLRVRVVGIRTKKKKIDTSRI